jgi:hypothetical protein
MRSGDERNTVDTLIARGLNDCQIARETGIPRRTVCEWRGERSKRATTKLSLLSRRERLARVPRPYYAYLLGMYLGDGHITRYPRTWRMRITLDLRWLRILLLCAEAMEAVFPDNRVAYVVEDRNSRGVVVSVYSNDLPALFPQHGPGVKHLRPIKLADWQGSIVEEHTRHFCGDSFTPTAAASSTACA